MNKDLIVNKSIEIKASPEQVWDALVNPEKIKVYLFGTQTTSDWKEGSSILFEGEYQGTSYQDKGKVLVSTPYSTIQYDYWSKMSGLEDKPENYTRITYTIAPINDESVNFTWRQQGFGSEQGYEHTNQFLPNMLKVIKELVEA